MSTVNIGRGSGDDGASFSFAGQAGGYVPDDVIDDISLSGASMTMGSAVAGGDAASVADSASSMATGGQVSCCSTNSYCFLLLGERVGEGGGLGALQHQHAAKSSGSGQR